MAIDLEKYRQLQDEIAYHNEQINLLKQAKRGTIDKDVLEQADIMIANHELDILDVQEEIRRLKND